MALPLLFFPFSVLSALSGLLMPEITRAHTKGDTDATRRLVFTMLKVTGAFSLAAGPGSCCSARLSPALSIAMPR